MDEPTEPVKKKKRKYTKRGPYKITLEGKSYQGVEIRREGKFLVLKTMKGSVMVNVETARTPIEIIGEVAVQSLTALVPQAGVPAAGKPVVQGHAAEVARFNRNKEIEGLLAMPSGLEAPDES